MTSALQEPSGMRGSAEKGRRPEPPGFLSAYPGYRSTALLDRLRMTEYSYLDAGGHDYLDYTGAGLPTQSQLNAHAERMRSGCFGNPHSANPASAASTELIEQPAGPVGGQARFRDGQLVQGVRLPDRRRLPDSAAGGAGAPVASLVRRRVG